MSASDLILCLICGKAFQSVGHHAASAHGITAQAYRDMHGIPRSRKLTSAATRQTFARLAADKGLGSDKEALRAMSKDAARKGSKVKADLIAAGMRTITPANRIPHERIAAIVSRAEMGERPYQVVREVGISWSAFHAGLKRHPDLLARYEALPIRRGRRRD